MTDVEKLKIALISLRNIANNYRDSQEIDGDYADEVGLDREEALEMSYDNIKWEAQKALTLIDGNTR